MRRALFVALASSSLAAPLLVSGSAAADVPGMFGPSPRSAAFARADVAAPEPLDAPRQNAALAAEPGLRLRAGYGYAGLDLLIDGESARVDDVGAISFAAQYGARVSKLVAIGSAFAVLIPDRYLAKLAFRPASEPQFVLYEAPLERTSVDAVLAVKVGDFGLGGGVAGSLDLGGNGTNFQLGQDARGTYADAALDVSLPYHFAPIVGAAWHTPAISAGASFRGPLAVDLSLDSIDKVKLAGNPLNGTTIVKVRGVGGYDPAKVDFGASAATHAGLTLMLGFEYSIWSAAPPPVADVSLDVHLGTTPSQREATFPSPRFRDTLSPRVAVELRRPVAGPGAPWTWAIRGGYAFSPSPVPPQVGFTSYADSDRHEVSFGGAVKLGRAVGVDWTLDAAGQVHALDDRGFDKGNVALPHPHYEVSGRAVFGSLSLEAEFK
jgi:hypothetical protein